MDANEAQKLALMVNALRPDWHTKSLRTFIERNLDSRTYQDCVIAFAWVATRTKTETPRLILEAGPWWRAAGTDGATPRPPRPEEGCATCGRRDVDHRGPHIDHTFIPLTDAAKGRTNRADLARAELTTAHARLCPTHHVTPGACRAMHKGDDQ